MFRALVTVLITFNFLSGGRVFADNSTIASIYNGAGGYCPKIQEEELDRFTTKCEASKLHNDSDRAAFQALSYRIYEEAAFSKVDQNQMLKNTCLIEQINLFKPLPNPMQVLFIQHPESKGFLSALGTPRYRDVLKKYKNQITHRTTHRPLTDEDIEDGSIWNFSFAKLKGSPEFQKDMEDVYNKVQKEHAARRENYRQNLASAWMGIRSAEMLLIRCQRLERDKTKDTPVYPLSGPRPLTDEQKTEQANRLKNKFGNLSETCGDADRQTALRDIGALSLYSLPTISAPEFFQVMQKHRNLITFKKTGKPVTDDELKNMDLRDLSSLQLGTSEEFEKDVAETFNKIKSQREKMNDKLKKPHSFPNGLDQKLRDEMFRDGTVQATLQEVGALPYGYRSLVDAEKSGQTIQPGPGCLMSRYEGTAVGEWADFFGKTMFFGGIAKASEATLLSNTSNSPGVMKKLKDGFNAGLVPAMPMFLGHMASSIVDQCKAMYTTQDTASAQWGAYIRADENLPKQIGYYRAGSDFSPEETPSCKETMDKNLIVKLSPSCGNVILNNLAMILGLSKVPLEAIIPITTAPEVYKRYGP